MGKSNKLSTNSDDVTEAAAVSLGRHRLRTLHAGPGCRGQQQAGGSPAESIKHPPSWHVACGRGEAAVQRSLVQLAPLRW